MISFTPGQRWISNSEPELGLGALVGREGRRIILHFGAVNERRVYASEGAPLTRITFAPGDKVESRDGWHLLVERLAHEAGLVCYEGRCADGIPRRLPETELHDSQRIDQPKARLLAGMIDPPHRFNLRQRTLQAQARLLQSPLHGLGGPRIELIPHQLYIAREVATRPAPRVLLADEVGLGKTIEACLILHHQLITGRASRALILVPEPLLHQWLVELLRRFNLRFHILDEERCEAIQASGTDNPFHDEQLVLCNLGLFRDNPERFGQALQGDWDLLIVDEAHHLAWHPDSPSDEYRLVEALALQTPGLLLLTATPEQLGGAGHFARLRLLDPDRYHDPEHFLDEERHYRSVAEAVEQLQRHEPLSREAARRLLDVLDEPEGVALIEGVADPRIDPARREEAREELIRLLLDRHGTGRVMFRNTRARISGFPERRLHDYPLPRPEAYRDPPSDDTAAGIQTLLTPERRYAEQGHPDWWRIDPRVPWLIERLRLQPDDKLLLICAHAETARELQEALRVRSGIAASLFHEGMSIVERDRAAAWFADPEGARLLICSEIGSEGRNFQFAHHLVLFDLPADPDLLEQRIGRLDRIGQRQRVHIHVPCLEPGPQALMLRWYRDGLDAFRHQVQGAGAIREALADPLGKALGRGADEAETERLITATRTRYRELQQRLQQGRDHLLELGACREPEASRLLGRLRMQDDDPALRDYLQTLFDSYNIDVEPLGETGFILRPGEQVSADTLPGLPEEGLTATYSRGDALSHEERQFLTWEHPLVADAMEQVLHQQTGNSAAIALRHPGLKPGQLLLESLFVVECLAPRNLQPGRFLPPTLLRILIDGKGGRHEDEIPCDELMREAQPLEAHQLKALLGDYRALILRLLEASEAAARQRLPGILKTANQAMMGEYTREIQRMTALKRHNPGVREEEIRMLQRQGSELHRHLQSTRLRLDALRLVVTL